SIYTCGGLMFGGEGPGRPWIGGVGVREAFAIQGFNAFFALGYSAVDISRSRHDRLAQTALLQLERLCPYCSQSSCFHLFPIIPKPFPPSVGRCLSVGRLLGGE